jgi:hypothetical protein
VGVFPVSRSISSTASSLALAGETMVAIATPAAPVKNNSRRVSPVAGVSSGTPNVLPDAMKHSQ